jgi:hypothetical protein
MSMDNHDDAASLSDRAPTKFDKPADKFSWDMDETALAGQLARADDSRDTADRLDDIEAALAYIGSSAAFRHDAEFQALVAPIAARYTSIIKDRD